MTHTAKLRFAASESFCAPSCQMSADPTFPVPPRMATLTVVDESVNAMWAARSAREVSRASTTTATCRSDDLCAMTRMLTLALTNEIMMRADTPLCMGIPSPTMTTMAMGISVRLMELTLERESSRRPSGGSPVRPPPGPRGSPR